MLIFDIKKSYITLDIRILITTKVNNNAKIEVQNNVKNMNSRNTNKIHVMVNSCQEL